MYDGKISNNTALVHGGGVFNSLQNTFIILGGEIFNNNVNSSGGGIFNYGTLSICSCVIVNNTASVGGGVYSVGLWGSFTMSSGMISGNCVFN